jgi:hypothetical protein
MTFSVFPPRPSWGRGLRWGCKHCNDQEIYNFTYYLDFIWNPHPALSLCSKERVFNMMPEINKNRIPISKMTFSVFPPRPPWGRGLRWGCKHCNDQEI